MAPTVFTSEWVRRSHLKVNEGLLRIGKVADSVSSCSPKRTKKDSFCLPDDFKLEKRKPNHKGPAQPKLPTQAPHSSYPFAHVHAIREHERRFRLGLHRLTQADDDFQAVRVGRIRLGGVSSELRLLLLVFLSLSFADRCAVPTVRWIWAKKDKRGGLSSSVKGS